MRNDSISKYIHFILDYKVSVIDYATVMLHDIRNYKELENKGNLCFDIYKKFILPRNLTFTASYLSSH